MRPLLAAAFLVLASFAATAQELVMFEEKGCVWCKRWTDEIGPIYPKTAEGRRAPLRRVDMHERRPEDLEAVAPVVVSPTFVLVDDGKEIGRIEGYPGEDFFWGLLGRLIDELPTAKPRAQSRKLDLPSAIPT